MIGVKIKQFELTNQIVKDFNIIFPNCPIKASKSAEVQICEITGPDIVRRVKVGKKEFNHVFKLTDTPWRKMKSPVNLVKIQREETKKRLGGLVND